MNTKTFSSIANTPISDNWGSDPSYTQAKKVGVQSRHGCKYSQVACNKITGIRVIAPPRYRPGTLNAQLLAKEDRLKDHHCPDKGPFLTFSHDVVFVCVCIHRVFSSFRFRTLRVLGHPVGLDGNLRLRSAKNWGREKATTAMAAKEPVACEREDSITSHPDLPCQDTGQIVSMPQTINISPK